MYFAMVSRIKRIVHVDTQVRTVLAPDTVIDAVIDACSNGSSGRKVAIAADQLTCVSRDAT